jgi:hypothetical protein
MGSTSARRALPRWAIVGGGAGGVLILGAAALFLLGPHDQPQPGPSPSQVTSEIALATASPRPTPRLTPRATPRPTPSPSASIVVEPTATPLAPPQLRAPLRLPASILDFGSRATVQVANLRVRQYVGTSAPIQVQLAMGSELLLRSGTITANGYAWYAVNYQPLNDEPSLEEGGGYGWVAAGLAGEPPTFIDIGPVRCPEVPVTTSLIASMTELAIWQCLSGATYELHAVVQTCYEGPITPYTYEPAYMYFSCYSVFELGTTVWLQIHIPPSLVIPLTLGRGDVVRVVGHVNDPAAADCRVTSTEAIDPVSIDIEDQVFRSSCQSAFVLSELEVTGHIDIPDPFGP